MIPRLITILPLMALASILEGQSLRPILFTDWGRLCSAAPSDTVRVCLPEAREFADVAWHPDGKRLVTDKGVFLDASGRRTGAISGFRGIRPVWFPTGQFLFAIDYDIGSAVRRWTQHGSTPTTIPVDGGVAAGRRFQMLAFSPSGRRAALLTMAFREMVIADVQPSRFVVSRTAPIGFDYVSQAVWFNDDTVLFVGKRGGNRLGVLWRLDVATGKADSVGIPGLALRDQIVIAPDRKSVAVTATPIAGTTRWNVWSFDLVSRVKRQLSFGTEDIIRSWR